MDTLIAQRSTGWRWRLRVLVAYTLAVALCAAVVVLPTPRADAVTDENPSFEIIPSDLEFILKQIKISEAHAAGGDLLCERTDDTSGTCVPSPFLPWGLRTVDGSHNNLIEGRTHFGSADQPFPRLLPIDLRPGEAAPPGAPVVPGTTDVCADRPDAPPTCYDQTDGFVYDSQPRTISNLIVDLTDSNPAAVAVAEKIEGSTTDADGRIFVPNEAPDEGLSAPFNTWFTFFGQFFDHGLDLVNKGGSGTVVVPLQHDDPLYDPGPDGVPGTPDDGRTNFLMLTRATNEPGPDGILGTDDDVRDHNNQTTPFVDQNQTYTSHPSHQVFLREYTSAGDATGHLLDAPGGGLATWADVKAQALDVLGIQLRDRDVVNVPLLRTDPYGNFVPGPNGNAQYATDDGFVEADGGVVPDEVLRTNHAFLDDIAHSAVPVETDGVFREPGTQDPTTGQMPAGTYDAGLLEDHFITGDGRGNENIGLTAVHHVFHAEHNRLVGHIEDVLAGAPELLAAYQDTSGDAWSYGQRLFQAARFVTEMEYQHLVFEEFGRKVQPAIDVAPLNESTYHSDIDAAIVAEFAHVVYRFGHSMLTEEVPRQGFGTEPIGLLDAFLDPRAFLEPAPGVTLTPEQAAGSLVNGMVNTPGSGIDEFVTETLRNELLGLPLDLATINLMRGREAGVPPLQVARQTFYAATGDPELEPYDSWADFGLAMKHRESLVNFIAAYGAHPSITDDTTVAGKRAAAQALLDADDPFLREPAATSGVDDIDFWMGGLAEAGVPFGGMLGTTFNYVFEIQMEHLQNADRFYYLTRNIGLNLFHQLEANSFSAMVHRTTDADIVPADIFATPNFTFDLSTAAGREGLFQMADGTWRFDGGEHVNILGTSGDDRMRGGIGDDSLWGFDGNDHITGGPGANSIVGGAGNDLLFGLSGDDNIKGGQGHDAINGGPGEDLILGGSGNDFIDHGADPTTSFAGTGNDVILGGNAQDIISGNEGDDWLEGGGGADLLQGDNANGFQDDPNGGHDVLWGGRGNNDHDAEGGDDIMIGSEGTNRYEGMLGFDWVTYRGVEGRANVDMDNTIFQPPSIQNLRSRFDLVEGLSGWNGDDVLRGVGRQDDSDGTGHELTEEHLDRIEGLPALLGCPPDRDSAAECAYASPFFTTNQNNNILLGGAGSDIIEGRGGDDLIDGSAWLNVQLEAPGIGRVDSAEELKTAIFSGQLSPGDITIHREIVEVDEPGVINTAVFSDDFANYEFTENADGTLTVAHVDGTQDDGTDTLRNVQQLSFADRDVLVESLDEELPTLGAVTLDTSPDAGEAMTATLNLSAGVTASDVLFEWQVEQDDGAWVTAPTSDGTDTFTPTDAEIGRRLRVVVTFVDGDGTAQSLTSEPSDAVTGTISDPGDGGGTDPGDGGGTDPGDGGGTDPGDGGGTDPGDGPGTGGPGTGGPGTGGPGTGGPGTGGPGTGGPGTGGPGTGGPGTGGPGTGGPGTGGPGTGGAGPVAMGCFPDTVGNTHESAICGIASAGITLGRDDGTFGPRGEVTRGQMASFLARALDLELGGSASEFSDVAGTTHARAIVAVTEAGIAQGFSDGTFRPNQPVSRDQMASFLARGWDLPPGSAARFSDVGGNTHLRAIGSIAKAGITNGFPDGTYRPRDHVSRDQMASFLSRAMDR